MSTNPGAYPPAPPPERSPAKKSNILLWILVAVGSLFLIAFAVVISGGLFIAHKVKDFAEVRDGKVVVKKEGKDVVISSSGKDSDGSVEIKLAGGSMKFGGGAGAKIPAWVPAIRPPPHREFIRLKPRKAPPEASASRRPTARRRWLNFTGKSSNPQGLKSPVQCKPWTRTWWARRTKTKSIPPRS